MKREELMQKVSQHWLGLIPNEEEDRSERWRRLLSLYPEAPQIFPEVALVIPRLSYSHESELLREALGVDETVVDHEGRLAKEILLHTLTAERKSQEIEAIERVMIRSVAPQILVWMLLRFARNAGLAGLLGALLK